MSLIVDIPVEANSVGEEVRVRIMSTLTALPEPKWIGDDAGSKEDDPGWHVIAKVANEDLPETVSTSPRTRGTYLWYQAAAFQDGVRLSNWSDPVSVEIPLLDEEPGFNTVDVSLDATDQTHEVSWDANDATGGVRVSWSIDPRGTTPSFDNTDDVDVSSSPFIIDAIVAVGETLTVKVESWETFAAGSVGGDAGEVATVSRSRIGSSTPFDPFADLACRVIVDDDHELILDDDHCLMLEDPLEE